MAERDLELTIVRQYDAPRELVFKVWTDLVHLAQWWACDGFSIDHCAADPRPGGAWRICMLAPDGTELWHGGVYREVVELERLVFTWNWEDPEKQPKHETLVTVLFADRLGSTELSVHQETFESAGTRSEHEGGWSEALGSLTKFLARMDSVQGGHHD